LLVGFIGRALGLA